MKRIEVAAALIVRSDGTVFAAQRGYGQWRGYWELPGGKLEKGESAENALLREIREELDSEIEIGSLLKTVEYDYPDFHLTMHIFVAKLIKGSLKLLEHESSRWINLASINSLKWLPADKEALDDIKAYLITL